MKKQDAFLAALGFTVSFLSFASVGLAQTDAEVNAGIQFNFSTPGARSLAMGGAFVGLADDATAAFTNPAGLLGLPQPEISLEGRRFDFTNTFTDRGHAFGFVTGQGVDTVEGLRTAEAENNTAGLSFISYVYPRPKWAFALYRHELVNFEAGFRAEGAFFDYFDTEGVRLTFRLRPVIAALDLEIVNFGFSAAYRLTDGLHIGLGISFYDFQIDSLQQNFNTFSIEDLPNLTDREFDPADFSPENELSFQEQIGSDEDTGLNVGLLWHISKKWWLGAVYRQGPEFELDVFNRTGAFLEELSGDPRGTLIAEQQGRFNVPDVFALGVAFKPLASKPSDPIRVTFDYNRIEYAALTRGLINKFEPEEFLDETERAALDGLAVDDGNAFRLGFEYLFLGLKCPRSGAEDCSVAVRLGAWHDPDHKVGFAAEPGIDMDTRAQAIQFLRGEDEIHLSAGLGFVFRRILQLDAAADFSDTVDTLSLSAIFRFGG